MVDFMSYVQHIITHDVISPACTHGSYHWLIHTHSASHYQMKPHRNHFDIGNNMMIKSASLVLLLASQTMGFAPAAVTSSRGSSYSQSSAMNAVESSENSFGASFTALALAAIVSVSAPLVGHADEVYKIKECSPKEKVCVSTSSVKNIRFFSPVSFHSFVWRVLCFLSELG